MGQVEQWQDVDLKLIEDHKLIYHLPKNCKLEQAAAQERNGDEIKMYQNSNAAKKLSLGQKQILRIHEALYILVRESLGDNSQPVRELLSKFLLKEPSEKEQKSALTHFMVIITAIEKKFVCSDVGPCFGARITSVD